MIMKFDSLAMRVLMFLDSPTMLLPSLLGLRVERARVANDYDTFVRVTFR